MPVKEKLLTDRAIRNAGAGTHNDGNGLTLRVGEGDKRSWVLRYTWGGKPANLGLGSYPTVGLKEARALAAVAVPVRLQPVDLLLGGDAPVEYL